MRQASLKLKSYANNINIIDNGNLHKKALYTMLSMFSILAFFYVLFLGNMVWNIVARKTIEKEALHLESEVLVLEEEYFLLSKNVDLELAHLKGFAEVKKNFVTRTNNFVSVITANDEI